MKYTSSYHCLQYRYVLARHLKRDEVIHPLVELGKFRGEPVYSRGSVLGLKTAENWMRQGRNVREGCQPMKWVKQNAVTVNKKRAIEMAMSERQDHLAVAGEKPEAGFSSEKDVMQGLYAENQTELYIPDPVINVCACFSVTNYQPNVYSRVKFPRTILGTLISMCRLCFPPVLHSYLVRVARTCVCCLAGHL